MLFPAATLDAIAEGRVTLAFRRWDRPRVRPGGRQRTRIGVVGLDAVEPVTRDELTDDQARSAGFDSLPSLLAFVDRRQSGTVYRIRLRFLGPDPRLVLRESLPTDREMVEVERHLARLDRASRHGSWTAAVLAAIADHPGTPAIELAASFGREKLPFKADVRKLKELGLTESLRPGYRLSPRGRAVLARLASVGDSAAPADERVEERIER
jgi:hypothetical protein